MTQPTDPSPSAALLERVFSDLGMADDMSDVDAVPPHPVPLPSRLATADLAWASAHAVSLMVGIRELPDPDRIATAYRSDRVLAVDGIAPDVWSAYSGFWRSADGWVRTHGNYPHHAHRLLTGLGLDLGASGDAVRAAILERTTAEAVGVITSERGLAVPVLREDPHLDARWRATPLLEVTRRDSGESRIRSRRGPLVQDRDAPLTGIRVLDLTRVIAGPVCTRTLALLGADVLRVDPPDLPEPEWQHLDTGHGKRTTLIEARSERFRELLAGADVVVLGYRPSSLDRLGLSAAALTEQYPGVVIAQLSAWGMGDPDRAGFDSLVQAESGISLIESPDGDRPGALPAQALDHSAGYLLATAVIAVLERRQREGGSWTVRTSLRRVAAELLGMPRTDEPGSEREFDPGAHSAPFDVAGRKVTTARPALPGLEFAAPHRWGSDQPRW
ncbi:CoA transferase [Microbacterium sp. WCS2018Hpa-23]|uniref:CoA transferase n=1 Tax=Microbacterium sp. WCS2018Hpa-23 TaxID=3073634 RepID=UPI00288315AD|nr:CoA transferase [Microbacterium sp. WCS2018Hpa-23]